MTSYNEMTKFLEGTEISKEDVERLRNTFELLDDPHIRMRNGPKCKFPDCWCNKPWEECEEKYETANHHS